MSYNLTLDIGNSWIKGAYFNAAGDIEYQFRFRKTGVNFHNEVNNPERPIDQCIVSNVRDLDIKSLKIKARHLITLNHKLHFPFTNLYASPETLGMDRVSAICGGMLNFPHRDLLVITAGTCLTYNLLTADYKFLGGGISPGLTMRYKALNRFTGKLPYIHHQPFDSLIGMDTQESIRSGVQNGLLAEVDEIINQYRSLYENIKVVMTGGATVFFENKLKNKIFADPNLIFKGLYHILKVNAK